MHNWKEALKNSRPHLPRVNAYFCKACGCVITTVDVDVGLTPKMINCRATAGCEGPMESNFYPKSRMPDNLPPIAWEWYKPEVYGDDMKEYIEKGGLVIRPRTDREPVYHK